MSNVGKLVRFYFSIDLRSLGLFRILYTGTLIYDWMLRWPNLEAFYTSFGVFPIEAPLDRAGGMYHFSLLDGFTSLPMVQLFFLSGLFCYLGLLVGYRTKLFQILSCVFLISVLNRNTMIRTGGDLVLVNMSVWAMFLPLGARFSIDALWQCLRTGSSRKPKPSAADVDDELCRPSLAAFGIVLQIALVYLLTAIDKRGPTWWDEGSAVYYAMNIDQFSTPSGKWIARLPLGWTQWLAWLTLGLEYAVTPLLLMPFLQPVLRRLAIICLVGLHAGTWATMHLGTFPFVMMSTYALLLLPADWRLLKGWLTHWSRPVTVYFDGQAPLVQRIVRLLSCIDLLEQIRLVAIEDEPALDRRLKHAVSSQGVSVYDSETGNLAIGSDAVLQILAALPIPWHVFGILGLPGLAWLTEQSCEFLAQRRSLIAYGFGWERDQAPKFENRQVALPPIVRAWRMLRIGVETLAVGFVMACVLCESYNDNVAPSWNKRRLKEPTAIRSFVMALQLIQDWSMFAPDPMRNDGWWVIEGETLSGNKIDPFTGQEPTWEKPAYLASQFDVSWRKYLSRISTHRHRSHRMYLCRYITRCNHRETSGDERLARFRLYFVQELTPPPGSTEPFHSQRIELCRHNCFESLHRSVQK